MKNLKSEGEALWDFLYSQQLKSLDKPIDRDLMSLFCSNALKDAFRSGVSEALGIVQLHAESGNIDNYDYLEEKLEASIFEEQENK